MSKQNHTFSVEFAMEYGIECAILIHHFQFWIEQNQRLGRNFFDERTWMYQTQKEIAVIYPYWSEDVVYKTIAKLVEKDVLIKGNYNKTPFDKTTWYAFKNEEMFTIPSNDGIGPVKRRNPKRQTTEPIPDTNPDTNKDTKEKPVASLPVPSPKKGKQRAENVFTSDEEHADLIKSYGTSFVEKFYKRLSEWKMDTPKSKWKKNDYRSILRWVIKAENEENAKNDYKGIPGSKDNNPVPNDPKTIIDEKKAICESIRGIVAPYCNDNTYFNISYNEVAMGCKIKDTYSTFRFGDTDGRFKTKLLKEAEIIFPRVKEKIKELFKKYN